MQNVEGGGSLTWEPSWSEVDAERGAGWTSNVEPCGRLTWIQVVVERGPRWAPDDGRPPNRDMEGHEALAWAPKLGWVGCPYRARRWARLDACKLGAHTLWTQKGQTAKIGH